MVLRMTRPYLNGTVWWLRKKVPQDLRAAVGVTEWKRSLKTRDPSEARVRFAKLNAELEEQWAGLRTGERPLSHKQIVALSGELCREFIAEHEENPAHTPGKELALFFSLYADGKRSAADIVGEPNDKQAALIKKLSDDARRNDRMIADFLLRRGMQLNEQTMSRFRNEVVAAMRIAREQLYRMQRSNYERHPELERFPDLLVPKVTSGNSPDEITLSIAIAAWVKEKTRKDGDWVDSSAASNELWARRFQELVGDKPLHEYKKADARKFKEAIMSLPPNFLQKEDFKKLDFVKAAEKAKTTEIERMSDRNVNKILGFVRAFWNWAEGQYGDVPSNPFGKMNLRIRTKARDERDPFSSEQLQAIFTAPLYTGCKSGKSYIRSGSHIPSDEGIYWVPLIGLFTGARSGEIIQLLCDDVKSEAGIRYFDIKDDGERKKTDLKQGIKTDSSMRTIPVHPMLEQLGFAAFVERQRRKGQRLFPDFPKAADGYYSTAYSPRFKRFLESIGVKTGKVSFHSFRHSFEDACKNSRIPLEFINALQGHSDGGMADRYGTGMVRVRLLKEEMDKLEYDGLDFSRLFAARKT
ncbi:Putative integrase [Neorhizobium galegae bv. orientalis]|nr:Putative integrase [Neorhizobium galegae bv. orientalis]